jgi:hypothetical protein
MIIIGPSIPDRCSVRSRMKTATTADVRRIALSLPGAEKVGDRFAFGARTKGKLKAFAWVWMERVTPKKPRVPNPGVIAVRVASLAERDRLLAQHPDTLFAEPVLSHNSVDVFIERLRVGVVI